MSDFEIPKNQGEILDKNLVFALKLASAENISDEEAVNSIAEVVERTMAEIGRPEFMDVIDPDRNHSETKLLSQNAKDRLSAGLEKYIAKYAK